MNYSELIAKLITLSEMLDEYEGGNFKWSEEAATAREAADALQALERVPDVEALIDDLSEWSRHVVEDTAHESLEKHVKRVLAHHNITPPESI